MALTLPQTRRAAVHAQLLEGRSRVPWRSTGWTGNRNVSLGAEEVAWR